MSPDLEKLCIAPRRRRRSARSWVDWRAARCIVSGKTDDLLEKTVQTLPKQRGATMSPHDGSQPPAVTDTPQPAAPADEHVYSYQQKYTRCHKPACRRCAGGPGHGPYWYAFWWEDGRTRTRYLGKTAPSAALAMAAGSAEPPSLPAPLPSLRGRYAGPIRSVARRCVDT